MDEKPYSQPDLQLGGYFSLPELDGISFFGCYRHTENKDTFYAIAQNTPSLTALLNKIGIPILSFIPDVKFDELSITIDSEKEIHLRGSVKLKEEVFKIADQKLNIATLEFDFFQSKKANKLTISLMGHDIAKIDKIDAKIKEYKIEFQYGKKDEDEKAEWHIGGKLFIEVFERLLSFSLETTRLDGSTALSFKAGLQPIVAKAYFSDIKGLDFEVLEQELYEKGILEKSDKYGCYQLKDGIQSDLLQLSKPLLPYQSEIQSALEKVNNVKKSVIKIPDLLNDNRTLFEVEPIEFNIGLEYSNSKFSKIGLSISSNLTMYSTWQEHSELFKIEKGTLAASFNNNSKEFKLIFTAYDCEVKPLNVVGLVPGMPDALHALYNDRIKEEAFMNMLSLNLNEAHFIKKGAVYDIGGSVKLFLNDGLKTVSEDLYAALDAIFPDTGDKRFIQGGIYYNLEEGLVFDLVNNNGIEISNLFDKALQGIAPELKGKIKADIRFDPDEAFDFGKSYIILERIQLAIKKEVTLTATIAFGLPSKLNDRLFGAGELNGIINTYDKKLLKPEFTKNSQQIQDNLIRVSLTLGTEGISGQLDNFDLINRKKLEAVTKGLTSFIVEESNALIIDFDTLANNKSTKETKGRYGKISIEKPKFVLNLKNGAFSVSGGFRILSEHLKLPVRGVVEKIGALLPLNEAGSAVLKELSKQMTDAISIKSIDFIKDNKLDLTEIENHFKQFLPEKDQKQEFFPIEFRDLIAEKSDEIVKYFPNRFKEFLSVKIPQELYFKFEMTADKSLSFAVEVLENKNKKNKDFSDYIQFLVPDFTTVVPVNWYGIRLRKIGFGTALFNQCFRLDLSVEIEQFNLIQMIAGNEISQLRNKDTKLDFILPDPDKFCQTFKANNLVVIIFLLKIPAPVPVIPIPVPLFYDRLYMKHCGIDGLDSEFNVESPYPELNIIKGFKELSDCINFFKNDDSVLPVPSHALAETGNKDNSDSLLRPFEAGPIYLELPGIIGYEKNSKNKIRLDFSDRRDFNALDIIHLYTNALKYSVLSLKEKMPYSIPIYKTDLREQPVNYLLTYLPAKQRMGSVDVVLFALFDISFTWAMITPDEFNNTYKPGSKAIITSGIMAQEEQGVVLFLEGAFKVVGEVSINVALINVLNESTGLTTDIEFNTYVADILQLHLWGALKVNPEAKQDMFMLAGASSFKLWDICVMKGSFKLVADSDPLIEFSGLLDLFPDESSPVKLYTGQSKGKKGPAIGHIDKKGILYKGGIHLEAGSFYLGGSTQVIADEKQNIWDITLNCSKTDIKLKVFAENDSLLIKGYADSVIRIGNDISITADSTGLKGPETTIILKRINGLLSLDTFRFDGAISILGNLSNTQININHDQFSLSTKTEIAGIGSILEITGENLLDVSSYNLSGTLDLTEFNKFVEGFLEPFQINTTDAINKIGKVDAAVADLVEMQRKKDFIIQMDNKYSKRKGFDGFDYVVPPIFHIKYWVNLSKQKISPGPAWKVAENLKKADRIRQQETYNLSGINWTDEDVKEVKQYWQYRKDLGIETVYPKRNDFDRWIKGTISDLTNKVKNAENNILNEIKNISNNFNHILKDLHIDSIVSDQVNNTFNQTITELKKINDELARCIKNKIMIVRIDEIKYSNLSISALKSKKFTANVTYSFLGREPSVLNNININPDDPALLITNICKEVLSL